MCHKVAPEGHRQDIKAHMHPPPFIPRCPHCMGKGFAWDLVPGACFDIGSLHGHCTAESFARFGDRCTAGVLGFLKALFHRASCKEGLPLHCRGPFHKQRHGSTEHHVKRVCRCTAGALGFLEALFHRAFCKERLPLLRKGK